MIVPIPQSLHFLAENYDDIPVLHVQAKDVYLLVV